MIVLMYACMGKYMWNVCGGNRGNRAIKETEIKGI